MAGPDGTEVPAGHVRVAAIQFCSVFGRVESNRTRLARRIGRAARGGAKIVVLPEACVPGYADMDGEVYWSERSGRGTAPVRRIAESLDGPSVRFFAEVCRERRILLTVPLIERDGDRYYNAVVLLGSDGEILLHHRKRILWDPGDTGWATEGEGEVPVAETPYGHVAAMICMDMHVVPALLEGRSVNLLLHCGGFYGPNFEGYLRAPKYTRKARRLGAALVLANWSTEERTWWSGYGMSRILDREGRLLVRAPRDLGDAILFADIPLPPPESPRETTQTGPRDR